MKNSSLRRFFSFLALIFLTLSGPARAQAQRAEAPMIKPLPATVAPAAPASGEVEAKKRAPAKSRKVSPRKMEIQTCAPDVRKIAPEGCLTPGGGVVTITGSCFGDSPGPYGAALKTGRGEIRKLDHRKWGDGSITLTLPPIPALAPGAGGVLGIASSSSEWFDGEPFTVCPAPARLKGAPKAARQSVQGGKVPGATLKKSVAAKSAESRAMTKAMTKPTQSGAGIGQSLYNDPPIPPAIIVSSPAAGELLTEGETRTVTWQYQGLPAGTCVNLWLYRGKPRHVLIRPNVCGTSWDWNVPGVPYGTLWNVRVEAIGTSTAGHSKLFTISRDVADPYIDSPLVLPADPKTGDTVTFTAQIRNLGGAAPTQNSAALEVTGPNGYHETYSYVFPLLQPGDPGSFFNVSESYTVPGPGAYYNNLSVTFQGAPGDTLFPVDATVPFYSADQPDLVACLPLEWVIQTNHSKTIPISVKNVGTAPSAETTLAFYLEGKGISYHAVSALDPGQSKHIPYPNNSWVFPQHLTMIASVDNQDTISELDEGNNRRCSTVWIKWGTAYNSSGYPPCSDLHPCTTPMPAGN